MPRFFFHVHDGISVFDDIGLELPDVAAAQAAAIELSSKILKDGPGGPLWQNFDWRVEVTDSPGKAGRLSLSFTFSHATWRSCLSGEVLGGLDRAAAGLPAHNRGSQPAQANVT
jgi:hypothetical protein